MELKNKVLLLTTLLSFTAGAQSYFSDQVKEMSTKVTVNVNFQNCKKLGYLSAAYESEDEWTVDFIQNDSTITRKNVKDFSGTTLENLRGTKTYSFNTKLHPDVNYSFRLREQDWGIYGDDDLYLLETFTPSYLIDEDLTCLSTNSCEKTKIKFTHKVSGETKDGEINCIKADFEMNLK